jgi:DNA-directed RNA polymerase sigma subunit (sigma70/sigma32)
VDFRPDGEPDPDDHWLQQALTKSERIDLGLELLAALSEPGTCHTQETIAAYCDCTVESVRRMERIALKKLRRALRKRGLTKLEYESR